MLASSGDIKDLTVPWLFQELAAGKKAGTAVFEREGCVKKVYFSDGEILFARSNVPDDQLAQFLLRQGKMNQTQFDSSTAKAIGTGKQLGAVLVELGILAPRELVSQVKQQVRKIILSLFQWRDGAYRFQEGPVTGSDIVPLNMRPGELIVEGLQSLDWPVVRKMLPPMKTVLEQTTDPELPYQDAFLDADQKTVLALIDGTRTMEQVCAQAGIGDFNALKAVHLLIALKIAAPAEPGKTGGRPAAGRTAQAATGGSSRTQPPEPLVTRDEIERAFSVIRKQNHYEILNINAAADRSEVKKAYFRLAKMYHPDRHLEREMADMKEKLQLLFSTINEAYQTLSNDERRREYDQKIRKRGESSAQFVEKHAEDYVENYAEKTKTAAAYYESGMRDFKVGNFWGAAEAFGWAIRFDPVKAPYFFQYGLSLMRIPRRRHEAEENLRRAIEIDPLNVDYHLELGNLYMKSGLRSKALDAYLVALRDNPASEKLLKALTDAGWKDVAEDFLKKGMKDKK